MVRWENKNLDFSHLPHELVRWEKNKIYNLALSHLSKPCRPFPSCLISACSQLTFDGMARLHAKAATAHPAAAADDDETGEKEAAEDT